VLALTSAGRLIEKFVGAGGTGLALVTSWATVIMMLLGTADVVGTKFFNSPVPATYEATAALMVALVFGGLAYAQKLKRHVKVELLVCRFPAKAQALSEVAGLLIGAIFFALFTWRSFNLFWQSWIIKEAEAGIIRFPIYPGKLLMVLGAGLMTVQLLVDIVHATRRLVDRSSA